MKKLIDLFVDADKRNEFIALLLAKYLTLWQSKNPAKPRGFERSF